MKVIVIGSRATVHRLIVSLAGKDHEVVSLSKVHEVINLMELEKFNLVVVDSLREEAAAICSYARELDGIPVALMVGQKQPDWAKTQSLGINGYLPREANGAELAARLQSIVRRYSFGRATCTPELKQSVKQMAKAVLMPNINETYTRTLCAINATAG